MQSVVKLLELPIAWNAKKYQCPASTRAQTWGGASACAWAFVMAEMMFSCNMPDWLSAAGRTKQQEGASDGAR